MKEVKIQTGLRIPSERYEELASEAERIGVSINSLILMLIDIGLGRKEDISFHLDETE